MNKPKYIEARYSAFLTWDLEELGIDWDKVKDYSISRGDLDISVDYKHNFEEALVLDESWNRVEEI